MNDSRPIRKEMNVPNEWLTDYIVRQKLTFSGMSNVIKDWRRQSWKGRMRVEGIERERETTKKME